MSCCGYIPIKRGDKASHVKAHSRSIEIIKSGTPMLYFPEGTRSKTGTLNKFKIGAFKLAEETNSKVIPICLKGTKDLLKKGSFIPGRANVNVKILEPISRYDEESLEDFAARARSMILAER